MKITMPILDVVIVGLILSQMFIFAGVAKSGVDSIYGESGIIGCAERMAEARKMPILTPEQIKAKDTFMKGCEGK